MSTVSDGGHHHEIIIVRHGGGDHEDGHHGGAWKIAFADFMTAMMCFFLVMWLINAANEQTKSAVASYFNPVKLIDRNSSRKGLEEIGDGPNALESTGESKDTLQPGGESQTGNEGLPDSDDPPTSDAMDPHSDDKLFADPYAVLAEIAANIDSRQNISAKGDGGAQAAGPATGADGGESYRDPFAPDFWSQQVETAQDTEGEKVEIDTRNTREERAEKAPEKAVPSEPAAEMQAGEAVEAKARQIEKELAEALGKETLGKGVSVVATERGVLISVTEELDFGMFEIGSATPRPELVRAMEKIGNVLSGHAGSIIVNGHTDGRPFRNDKYDNWRLSASRAQSAYYMIVRSGLEEKRVTEIAGFADRKLKNPADPLAAENRRIEILLETDG